jgi:hypothetical protein
VFVTLSGAKGGFSVETLRFFRGLTISWELSDNTVSAMEMGTENIKKTA